MEIAARFLRPAHTHHSGMVGELNYREAQESQWLASFQETSNRINRGRIYSQAASSSVSVDGPLWSPFDSLFPRIPAASHPWGGREQMAATQSSLVSTYNRPPLPNSAAFLGSRGLETQGQTYHGPRLTGGKTHKPEVRLCWQVKTRTPLSSQDPFPFCPKVDGPQHRAGAVGKQAGPLTSC